MHRYTYYYPLALDTPKPAVKYPVILNRMSPEVHVISSTTSLAGDVYDIFRMWGLE